MTDQMRYRFYIISETLGLVGVRHDQYNADLCAMTTAVTTARTVYVHDRLAELELLPRGCPAHSPHDPADSRYHDDAPLCGCGARHAVHVD